MMRLLLIGVFGGLGAISRYLLAVMAVRCFGEGFPIGTLIANVAGCFLLGLLYETAHVTQLLSEDWLKGLGVGFLGGLTTFSTFGGETLNLARQDRLDAAGLNIAANLAIGLLAVWLGVTIVKFFAPGS